MGRTACTERQCLYKGALYFLFLYEGLPETCTVTDIGTPVSVLLLVK